ncbi:MAG: peptidylprolyl isomerase [Candidatus Omnitrophica bacterium]|nr:peptidylprolyl isomerase [Candidatus Omnitrophota bacterium]
MSAPAGGRKWDRRAAVFLAGAVLTVGVFLYMGIDKAKSKPDSETELPATAGEPVGEAFGKPVSAEEFQRHYRTANRFSRSGKVDRTEAETRQEAWENLVFLDEAQRLGITVSRPELDAELKRLLQEKGIEYGGDMYRQWVRLMFREDVDTFEKGLEDLLRINKLLKQKTTFSDTAAPATDKEIEEKFRNQYNNFESEYIRFENKDDAEKFLKKVRSNPRLWKETYDAKKAEKGQEGAAWINIMTIEAQVDLWKMPKEDAYRVIGLEEGEFAVARNYYGDCVYRLLHKRTADPAKLDDKMREYYRTTLSRARQHQAAQSWLDDLIRRAGIKDYAEEKRQEKEKVQPAAKTEQPKENTMVTLETNQGVIEIQLLPEAAPKACENFIGLAEKGYYNGLIFHRVIKQFMIQGGDPTGTGTGGQSLWGKPFEDEFDKSVRFDKPGILAMANAGPRTNGSQFFITTAPTPWLNDKHTIFGEVVKGMDVVKKIEQTPTAGQDKPKEPQKILKVEIRKQAP